MKRRKISALMLASLLAAGSLAGCAIPGLSGGSASDDSVNSSTGGANVTPTELMDYESYKGEYYYDIAGWGFPAVYTSETPKTYDIEAMAPFAKDMADAGITTVNFAGVNNLIPGRQGSLAYVLEQDKRLIELFNEYGMKSTIYTSNWANGGLNGVGELNWDHDTLGIPDFSDVEGFNGLMVWDEPVPEKMPTLANYANDFNKVYKDSDAVFKVNLLPSYWSQFGAGISGSFSDYLKSYCDTVLSQVKGEKYLSVDTYAVNVDKTMDSYLLYNFAMVKKYALEYGAHAHMALQSAQTAQRTRTPEYSELAQQANTALAFGMDSISWYTYVTPQEAEYVDKTNVAPVDLDGTKNETYEALKKVNLDIAAFGYAYKCFDWKGVVLNSSTQISAMNLVRRNKELMDFVLTTEDLNSISAISSKQDYIMGVMEDANGNEGFMLVNYSDLKSNIDSIVDFTFDGADRLMIWRDGKKEILELENNGVSLTLKQGEGMFMIPYKA